MYELSKETLNCIAGGIYVTQEWKDSEAQASGKILGLGLTLPGAIVGYGLAAACSVPVIAISTSIGVLTGGLIGYGMGYGLSKLENASLKNDTWYS